MDCRDKGLELLAKRTRIDMEMKNSELEELNVEIPSDYHEDMLNFVRALDRENSKRKKKNRVNQWTRIAAIFLISFIMMNTVAIGTSEAYRKRVMSLFRNEESGSVTLRSDAEYKLLGESEGYWYPAGLPDTYELLATEESDEIFFMFFMDRDNQIELRISQYAAGQSLTFDTSKLSQKKFDVGAYEGYIFYDEAQLLSYAVWGTDKKTIIMEFVGEIAIGDVEEVARGMVYIE